MRHRFLSRLLCSVLIGVFACAGAARADFCRLPWDVPCCFLCDCPVGVASVNLEICNCTDVPSVYRWDLSDANGLLQFNPATGSVYLQPGECTVIPITICCSPNLQIGAPAIYSATIINQTTGATFGCDGSVVFTGEVKLQACDPTVPVEPGVPSPGGFVATNMSSTPASLTIFFEPMGQIPVEVIPSQIQVDIPPDGDAMNIPLSFLVPRDMPKSGIPGQPQFVDVLASWDQDGDGEPEVGSSIALRIVGAGCDTDFDGDGQTGSSDLAVLLGSWGPCP